MGTDEVVVKFYADFGRMGNLEGLFKTTKAKLENVIGKRVYFGEVLGKHSNVELRIEQKHLKVVTDDPEKIALIDSLEVYSGHNPISYLADMEE